MGNNNAHKIRITRNKINNFKTWNIQLSEKTHTLVQIFLILIMSGIIWGLFYWCPFVPVTNSSEESQYGYSFVSVHTFSYVADHGFFWTHYGRIGWCGVEPERYWHHSANVLVCVGFFLLLPLLILAGLIISRMPRLISMLSKYNCIVFLPSSAVFFQYKGTAYHFYYYWGLPLEAIPAYVAAFVILCCSLTIIVYYIQKRLFATKVFGKWESFNMTIALLCLILSLYFLNYSGVFKIG